MSGNIFNLMELCQPETENLFINKVENMDLTGFLSRAVGEKRNAQPANQPTILVVHTTFFFRWHSHRFLSPLPIVDCHRPVVANR